MSHSPTEPAARLLAGIPAVNSALYHRLRFAVGDPTAIIELRRQDAYERIVILRDIEMNRARRQARADRICCPADFTPEGGLSGDRETATAQAAAECLRRHQIQHVVADRTLPLIYTEAIQDQGIVLECDRELGVAERRSKDEQELEWIRQAQADTERAIAMACEMVCHAKADPNGQLYSGGSLLTSERLRAAIDHWLLDRGYQNPPSIVACGPQGADCHQIGHGPILTGQPVIIDVFPQHKSNRYNGDCTRTVIHGEIPEALATMHAAVLSAKKAAEQAIRPGVTGEQVHAATAQVIESHGFKMGLPTDNDSLSYCGMVHGTGHGLGLDVHEPPLLDWRGPPLVRGDVLTIEPGLYRRDLGGVRVEDMVVVTQDGIENVNRLPVDLRVGYVT